MLNVGDPHRKIGNLSDKKTYRVVLVTGASGAGRSTAVHALEDIGYEVIDNIPLTLVHRLIDGPPLSRPIALGIDVRNRDFSFERLQEVINFLKQQSGITTELLFLDCRVDVLVQRYSATRRRHPLSPDTSAQSGIDKELEIILPIKQCADYLIDTSELSPHELRREVEGWFAIEGGSGFSISVKSFSYRRGLPRGADYVFDCRFLNNPHWNTKLRDLDGRNEAVKDYVFQDDRYKPFLDHILAMSDVILPAISREGKPSVTIAFGCTGGQHRSVAIAEKVAKSLAERGWQVSIEHRELDDKDQHLKKHIKGAENEVRD